MEDVIELIEINIHEWTRRPGHLAACLMPASVTGSRCPAGSEGSLLRSGRGHMAVMSVQRSREAPRVTRTSKIWIGGRSELTRSPDPASQQGA